MFYFDGAYRKCHAEVLPPAWLCMRADRITFRRERCERGADRPPLNVHSRSARGNMSGSKEQQLVSGRLQGAEPRGAAGAAAQRRQNGPDHPPQWNGGSPRSAGSDPRPRCGRAAPPAAHLLFSAGSSSGNSRVSGVLVNLREMCGGFRVNPLFRGSSIVCVASVRIYNSFPSRSWYFHVLVFKRERNTKGFTCFLCVCLF